MKPVIAITMGDFNGIGPEVALKSALSPAVTRICSPLLIGSIDVFEWYARRLNMRIFLRETDMPDIKKKARGVPVINLPKYETPVIRPGAISSKAGRYAGQAIEKAVALSLDHTIDGVTTSPVSKEALLLGGYDFPGQTEMFAALTRSKNFAMMLISKQLKVGLVTAHTSLKNVPQYISRQVILKKLVTIGSSLKKDFAISRPKIAVLGLNPHAGEHGMLGIEEQQHIVPAIRDANRNRMKVDGPFPADGFFGNRRYRNYDAVLAMYHDQGLIPLKLMDFEAGVNYSSGLPIVRTSPDHGTAFDIAGKGMASPTSTIEAIKLAVAIAEKRPVVSR